MWIYHLKNPVFFPEANAQVKQFNRTGREHLTINLRQLLWREAVDKTLYDYLNTPHSRTPDSMFFNRNISNRRNCGKQTRFVEPLKKSMSMQPSEVPSIPRRSIRITQGPLAARYR